MTPWFEGLRAWCGGLINIFGGVGAVEGDRPVEIVRVPVLDLRGMQGVFKCLNLFAVALAFGNSDDNGEIKRVVEVFESQ